MTAERLLTLLLRLSGCLLLLAIPFVFWPVSWMAREHEWLGLGEFSEAPLTDYLTRSASALYALHGGILLLVSFDVRRYAPLVRYLGAANILFGAALLGIDLHAGMPLPWVIGEGPSIIASGLLILVLQARSGGIA